jgi:hypothetical protein
MKRLCVIGNSHVAALKLGWERLRASYPGMSLTFFGTAGRDACKNLRLVEGALVPDERDLRNFLWTSGGREKIKLEDYDHFLLVSLGFGPQEMFHVARKFSFAEPRLDQSKRLVSRECFMEAVTDTLLGSMAAAITTIIRKNVNRPVLILPQAASSIEIIKTDKFRAAHSAAPAQCWALLNELWAECATSVATRLGAAIVLQPAETVSNHIFTAHEFCRGSVRLTPDLTHEHPDHDFTHMNADYGIVTLKTVLGAFAK